MKHIHYKIVNKVTHVLHWYITYFFTIYSMYTICLSQLKAYRHVDRTLLAVVIWALLNCFPDFVILVVHWAWSRLT